MCKICFFGPTLNIGQSKDKGKPCPTEVINLLWFCPTHNFGSTVFFILTDRKIPFTVTCGVITFELYFIGLTKLNFEIYKKTQLSRKISQQCSSLAFV